MLYSKEYLENENNNISKILDELLKYLHTKGTILSYNKLDNFEYDYITREESGYFREEEWCLYNRLNALLEVLTMNNELLGLVK